MEDEVNAGAALTLSRDVFDEISMQLVAVHLNVLGNQIKDQRSLVLFVCNYVFLVIS